MKHIDAVVAGHLCLDIIPEVPPMHALMVPGAVVEIGPAVLATGGPPSNTGRSLYRLGLHACLIGKVGDDSFGKIILDLIREDDPTLAEHIIVASGEASSYTVVISPPGTDRFFMHNAGANHTFGVDDVPYDLLREARLFHFGYPPYMKRMYANDGVELIEMFKRAKASGVITSLDMALPDPKGPSGQVNWRRVLERCLPYVDLFLPSLDEVLFMLHPDQPPCTDELISEIGAELLAMGAGVVVLKLGSRGVYLRTGPNGAPFLDSPGWSNRELWAPCFQPEPLVGTTGSGDATIAGFLAGILRGQPVEDALTSAVAVGACNVEAADALSGIRSWEATQARIASGWARSPVTIHAPGWAWDAGHQLWIGPYR